MCYLVVKLLFAENNVFEIMRIIPNSGNEVFLPSLCV